MSIPDTVPSGATRLRGRLSAAWRVSWLAAAALALPASAPQAQGWLPASVDPPWARCAVERVVFLAHDGSLSELQNGVRLAAAVAALEPGDQLLVGPGTYSMLARFEILLQGTAERPIRITGADPRERPVITRPDNAQNIINVGLVSGGQSRYLALGNLELTGGSDLIRLYDCRDIWIDRCYLHDGQGVGIAANSNDTAFLYITRNEIARPCTGNPVFTGEGMYLGQNQGGVKMSDSVIAYNHVHDTQVPNPGPSYQGDGIEVKQGSYRNWIVGNHVHQTRYPCLLVHGTGDAAAPQDENVIEGNLLYDSQDNVMQVQADAIVRNNVAIYTQGGGAAFSSFDHQGPVRSLSVVHNTFLNVGRAANLRSWSGAPDLVFANNVCYSQTTNAVNFVGGSSGVVFEGNVTVGQVAGVSGGFAQGSGLSDFVGASWTGSAHDVTPVTGRAIDNHGAWQHLEPFDRHGKPRSYPADPGAVESAPSAWTDVELVPAASGGTQTLTLEAGPLHADRRYLVLGSMTGITPAIPFGGYDLPLVLDAWTQASFVFNTGPFGNTFGTLDGQGSTTASLTLPPVPGLSLSLWHCFTVWDDANNLRFVSAPLPLEFR